MGIYLLIINIFSLIFYGIDKYLAIKKKFRISEYQLFLVSFLGGALGSIVGMLLFHHKTRKIKFWIFNLICLTLWCLILWKFI